MTQKSLHSVIEMNSEQNYGAIVKCYSKSNTTFSPLHEAIEQNKEEEVISLLAKCEDVNDTDENGSSLLHKAVRNINFEISHHLLNHGADVNIKNSSLKTPLHIAAEKGHIEITKLLLFFGANKDSQDDKLCTPLHIAIMCNHEKIVQILLEHHADVNIKAWDNTIPLHFAASMNRQNISTLLLKTGANIEDKTAYGYTPLHLAMDKSFLDIAQELLQNGACINTRNFVGSTPLIEAIEKKDLESVKFLIQNNADLGFQGFEGSPLHYAVKGGNLDVMELLLDAGIDVNTVSSYNGYTPLHWAVIIQDCRVVKFLLDKNADVNLQMKCRFTLKSYTPLALAIKYRKFYVIEILLMHVFLLRQNEMIKKASRRYRGTMEESDCNRSKISSQNILYLNRFLIALETGFTAKKRFIESDVTTLDIDHLCLLVRAMDKIEEVLEDEKMEYKQKAENSIRYLKFLIGRRLKCIKLWSMSFDFFHFILKKVLLLSNETCGILEPYFVKNRNISSS